MRGARSLSPQFTRGNKTTGVLTPDGDLPPGCFDVGTLRNRIEECQILPEGVRGTRASRDRHEGCANRLGWCAPDLHRAIYRPQFTAGLFWISAAPTRPHPPKGAAKAPRQRSLTCGFPGAFSSQRVARGAVAALVTAVKTRSHRTKLGMEGPRGHCHWKHPRHPCGCRACRVWSVDFLPICAVTISY